MNKVTLMTPGPTEVSKEVLSAMAKPITNPDLDRDFFDFYKSLCDKFNRLVSHEGDSLILSGEGILGLEAACASLIETNDRVLCIENGIFGHGFGDFVDIYGGEKVYFHGNKRRGIDLNELENFLEKDNDFKVATLVHCETPSGITNDIEGICKLLNKYDIISVVDAVSSAGGELVLVDKWGIDILIVGSQKCLSAPPGLTPISISSRANKKMRNRKESIKSFYCNLLIWDNWYKEGFPYTQPVSNLYALDKALDIALERDNLYIEHKKIGEALRYAIEKSELELYPQDSYSNTVTTIIKPENVNFDRLFEYTIKNGIMIAGAFAELEGKVIRIGHMGMGCCKNMVYEALRLIREGLNEQGVIIGNIEDGFLNELESL